jgi:hypothetical protein
MNTAQLYEAIDLISKGVTRPTAIARVLGVTYRAYRGWLVRSNNGDEKFLITVNSEQQQFAKAVAQAMKLAHFELRGMVLQDAIGGYFEEQTKDGQVVWALDPVACAIPEEDREWMGYRKDGLLEVNGALVPHTVRKKAPWAQQIRLLEAVFPDLRPSQTINSNVAVNGSVGIGYAKPTDYSAGPPKIPAAPPMPELPAPTDAEFNEVAPDDDLEDFLGPEPQPAPEPAFQQGPINVVIAPEISVEQPERVIRSAPTAREKIAPQTTGILGPKGGPLTPLQRDLLDRVLALRAKGVQT